MAELVVAPLAADMQQAVTVVDLADMQLEVTAPDKVVPRLTTWDTPVRTAGRQDIRAGKPRTAATPVTAADNQQANRQIQRKKLLLC